MANIFAGLEALDNVENEDFSMEDMTEELVELSTLNEEYDESVIDLNDTTARFESVFTAMDDIEHLMNVIETHGISKSLMAHADPTGYLVEKLGIPAVEMLDATPINDANAQAALEGFKETMKKWGEAIKKFFKMIWEKMKAFFAKVVQMFSRYESILKKLTAKLGETTMDPKKAKDKKLKCLSHADLDKFGSELGGWATDVLQPSSIEKFTTAAKAGKAALQKELKSIVGKGKVVGLKLNAAGDGFESVEASFANAAKENSIADHGYDVSKCKAHVHNAIGFAAYIRSTPKVLTALKALGSAADAKINSVAKSTDKEASKTEKDQILAMKTAAGLINRYIAASMTAMRKYIKYAIMTANAVIACKK